MSRQRVSPENLAVGMYVCELDRPWLDSPFLFQGFPIQSERDIRRLREYCQWVIVDTERSIPSSVAGLSPDRSSNTGVDAAPRTGTELEQGYQSFHRELKRAIRVREKAREWLDGFFGDAAAGRPLDVEGARRTTLDLLDTIIADTNASLWLTNLRSRQEYAAIHCINVCVLSLVFGRHLGMSREKLEEMGTGALVMDVGKQQIPATVLNKPGPLSDAETEIAREHAVAGYRMLKDCPQFPPRALEIVRHHHERVDGSGYPDGLTDEVLDEAIRVVGLCDAYDAMTSERPYQAGISGYKAITRLYRTSRDSFGQRLMEEFINCIGIYPVGCLVELNTGARGLVISTNPDNRLRPVVMLVMGADEKPYRQRPLVNLAALSGKDERLSWYVTDVLDPRIHGDEFLRAVTASEIVS